MESVLLRQLFIRRRKILFGFIGTYLKPRGEFYLPDKWFDNYYSGGVSDKQTIAKDQNVISAAHHYASVEMLIARHLVNKGIRLDGASVFDIGSGAGHWIDFYKTLGAATCAGIDISETPVEFLRNKYKDDQTIKIYKGLFQDFLESTPKTYDLINAIGVIFHVVDDSEWERGLRAVSQALRPGGIFIVGGHFGWLNNINTQIDSNNQINKRLRSKRRWIKILKKSGFTDIKYYYNPSYMFINDNQPENHLLIARKQRN